MTVIEVLARGRRAHAGPPKMLTILGEGGRGEKGGGAALIIVSSCTEI